MPAGRSRSPGNSGLRSPASAGRRGRGQAAGPLLLWSYPALSRDNSLKLHIHQAPCAEANPHMRPWLPVCRSVVSPAPSKGGDLSPRQFCPFRRSTCLPSLRVGATKYTWYIYRASLTFRSRAETAQRTNRNGHGSRPISPAPRTTSTTADPSRVPASQEPHRRPEPWGLLLHQLSSGWSLNTCRHPQVPRKRFQNETAKECNYTCILQ